VSTFAEHAARRRKIADEMEASPLDQRRGEIDSLAHKIQCMPGDGFRRLP